MGDEERKIRFMTEMFLFRQHKKNVQQLYALFIMDMSTVENSSFYVNKCKKSILLGPSTPFYNPTISSVDMLVTNVLFVRHLVTSNVDRLRQNENISRLSDRLYDNG